MCPNKFDDAYKSRDDKSKIYYQKGENKQHESISIKATPLEPSKLNQKKLESSRVEPSRAKPELSSCKNKTKNL